MVTKTKTGKKKGKVKVSKLKVNKETVNDLTGAQKKNIRGGAIREGLNETKVLGCSVLVWCR
jgi:hypothetical protein